jgi:hypothetical protein
MSWRFEKNTLYAPDGSTWHAHSGGIVDTSKGINKYKQYDDGTWRAIPSNTGLWAKKPRTVMYTIKTPYSQQQFTSKGVVFRTATTDPSGNMWFVPLMPTVPFDQRDGFGIHPDGGDLGTHGCIGIMAQDTSSLRELLYKSRGQLLQVIPSEDWWSINGCHSR